MNIFMFNTRLNALQSWGGDSTQMVSTQRELQRLGISVDLGTKAPKDLSKWDLIHFFNLQTAENGIDVLNNALMMKIPIVLSSIYWDLRRSIANPDILRYGSDRFYRCLASVAPKVAVHVSYIRHIMGHIRRRRAQRKMLDSANIILPNSIAELEILVSLFNLPGARGKAVVVPNGVAPPIKPGGAVTDAIAELPEKYVLMAANFHPVKGQDRLIQALMDVPELPLVCVGRGLGSTWYGRYCGILSARRNNTYLLDEISHDRMPTLYQKARVHALPSLRESPGLASLEAASYGANCVVGFHAPVWEYFENDAFVCDPENLQSIRKAVLRAWKAPPADKLKERILRNFTWSHAAKETLRGYEFAIKNELERGK